LGAALVPRPAAEAAPASILAAIAARGVEEEKLATPSVPLFFILSLHPERRKYILSSLKPKTTTRENICDCRTQK